MLNTLIIKLGAMGDVLRTTPLLRALSGNIFWITRKESIPLLKAGNGLREIIDLDYAEEKLKGIRFDLVICLEDDARAAELASRFNSGSLVGSFRDDSGKLSYTDSSKEWFDMGLISKFGKLKADNLKKSNIKSYQEIIFGMLGKKFTGEEYILNFKGNAVNLKKDKKEAIIGIESRADSRWPAKQWDKYIQLGEALRKAGRRVVFFKQRESIRQYIEDISICDLIVSGDTLALHIALALKIKSVAVFTCTSPAEIYDYRRMIKVVSPALDKAFYKREYIAEAVSALSLESLFESVKKLL